jgi:KEOPS complex subunit Cgi121
VLRHLEEFGKVLTITGYRNVSFQRAEAYLKQNRKGVQVQFFEADLIATQEHLYFSALNALRSFENHTNISKSPAMETILYTAAVRQIQKAIERLGVKSQTKNVAAVVFGESGVEAEKVLRDVSTHLGAQPDESVLELTAEKTEKIKAAYNITDSEIRTIAKNGDMQAALVNLVVERVALLATQL